MTLNFISDDPAEIEEALFPVYNAWKASGKLPEQIEKPLLCGSCGKEVIFKTLDPSFVSLRVECPKGHYGSLQWPAYYDDIRGIYNQIKEHNGQLISFADTENAVLRHSPQWPALLSRFIYTPIPRGYCNPATTVFPATYGPVCTFSNPDADRVRFIMDRQLRSFPNMQWVERRFFNAIYHTDFPEKPLSSFRYHWEHGFFLLPPDVLHFPSGYPCHFIGFAFADPGYHPLVHHKRAYYTSTPRLVVWAMTLPSMETITAEITLDTLLTRAEFHDSYGCDTPSMQHFIKEVIRLTLLFNMVAPRLPGPPGMPEVLKTTLKDQSEIYHFNAPLLGFVNGMEPGIPRKGVIRRKGHIRQATIDPKDPSKPTRYKANWIRPVFFNKKRVLL